MRGYLTPLGILSAILVVAGCGNERSGPDVESGVETSQSRDSGVEVEADGSLVDTLQAADSAFEAVQLDGVWVFQHALYNGYEALLKGSAEIVDDCLLVSGYIVIWHRDHLSDIQAIVSAVQGGEHIEVEIGGGELAPENGAIPGQVPAVVTKHCSTTGVWFGGLHLIR